MSPHRKAIALGTCVLGLAGPATAAAEPTPLQSSLDATLAQARDSAGTPAATGAVIRCGQLLWSGAAGVMDLDSQRPATPRTLFTSASTGKPITAALVLDLVERHKLSLSTRLSRFYPHLPNARRITVRMLLDHTSGLSEYFDDPRIVKIFNGQPTHHWTRGEVIRAITRSRFAPGTRYAYTNSNYVVLGGIVEKVTRRPIERVFQARIAARAGMADSTMDYRPQRSTLFAHPYISQHGKLQDLFVRGVGISADYWGPVWTDGGLASTAQDMARFGDALFEGRLLHAATVRTMTRVVRSRYGLGVVSLRYAGRTWHGHDGAYVGYSAQIWNDHARGVTIFDFTNSDGSSVPVWRQLVAAYDRAGPRGACPNRPSATSVARAKARSTRRRP